MVNKERILTKIKELQDYLKELKQIIPKTLEEYKASIEKKRACERLLHVSIECVLDVCDMIVEELDLGIPSDEEDILEKLKSAEVIPIEIVNKVKEMKRFRNVLVHRYGLVKDENVFEILTKDVKDINVFINEILEFLKKRRK